jgi:hypothetical protein
MEYIGDCNVEVDEDGSFFCPNLEVSADAIRNNAFLYRASSNSHNPFSMGKPRSFIFLNVGVPGGGIHDSRTCCSTSTSASLQMPT